MIVWIDAQLSPALADWMTAELGIEAHALRDLGLRDAADREIFDLARAADAVIFTKDSDFLPLLEQHGATDTHPCPPCPIVKPRYWST